MAEDRTRMHVGGASPYDVVVGHGVLDELPRPARPGRTPRRGAVTTVTSTGLADQVRGRLLDAGYEVEVLPLAPPRRGGQDLRRWRRRCWEALGRGRLHPLRRRSSPSAAARPPTSAASSRRPGCAACASCTCRRRCSAWSTRRSAARPASTPAPARTSSAPSTSRPACSATSTCSASLPQAELVSGLGEVIKCGFVADPEILAHRRGRPGGGARPRLAAAARGRRASDPGEDRRRRRRPQGDRWRRRAPRSRGAQLRPHDGARGREGHRLPRPARRGGGAGHGLRGRAGPAGRPPRRRDRRAARRRCWRRSGCPPGSTRLRLRGRCSPPCGWTRSRAASMLRFVVLDGLAGPAVLADPDEDGPAGGVRR